ncbi:hypothetical protein EDB82DRAFT_531448 [Fusarium venenatum]|uniref:uncharacterized protein n=1 Tax=Fusarium venenatum TaxID=56646 RepID=UPI001DF916FD|nr:hypothetical protein EDB82DRAFT_531448 [Fusarium venenatum]
MSTKVKADLTKPKQPQEPVDDSEDDSLQEPIPIQSNESKGVPKNKLSATVKVTRLANADEKSKDVVLATLQRNEINQLSLAHIRQKIKSIDDTETFCFKDQSPADDSLLLEDYLQQSFDGDVDFTSTYKPAKNGEQESIIHKCFLYLPPQPTAEAHTMADNLALAKFFVKVFEWSAGESGVASRGNLQSSKLGVPDATLMTLAGLRKQLATCTKMSVASKTHQFCTQSGETVVDEAMTFPDYLSLEETSSDTNSELPSVHVFYKLAHPKNEPPNIDLSNLPGKLEAADTKVKENAFENGKTANTFESRERASELPEFGQASTGAADNDYALHASYLTDLQWAEVLRNCGAIYGWVVDRHKNRIVRAPKPAFQLRAKLSEDATHAIPDVVEKAPESEPANKAQITQADIDEIKAKVGKWDARSGMKGELPGITGSLGVKLITETSKEGDTTVATKDASTETTEPIAAPAPGSEPQEAKSPVATSEPVPGKAVYTVLPSFQVNDDSRIEITVSSHEFETSMARNDFSNHSTEGSMSGGFGGFSASVSAGYSKETSKSTKDTTNTYKKTMIAKYLLPRADILLHPTDLEPSPEFKAALENIRTNKNIADLHETVTSEQEQKEAMKVSVGVQVTTPFGGGGIKHTNENGKAESKSTADVKKDESNVFEAVGGDTILTANPTAWSSTVADYRTWRVIDRDSLSSLADTISAIPGYAQVRSWFMQAVPTLSKYIELPPSREIKLRFKLTAPTSQLSLSYLKKVENYDAAGDPIYYLGHSTGADVRPVKNELTISNNAWAQCDITDAQPLFSPQSYRAPVIMGYRSNIVGDSAYGSQYNQDYTNSLWNVSAPFNDALAHGVLVCISTVPLPKSAPTAGAAVSAAPDTPLFLEVFRNQQSVFLPGLSDSSERHYWRILKHGAKSNGEYIKEGDEIYFAWAFKDQTGGFRDFAQDVFGRRRLQFPDNLNGKVLYMKLPWPRFEPLAKPTNGKTAVANTMILTGDPIALNNTPQMASIKTAPGMMAAAQALSQRKTATDASVFGLQDVRFRVDVVGNDGYGDVGNCLLKGLEQGTEKPVATDPKVKAMQSLLQAQLKYYEALMFLGV